MSEEQTLNLEINLEITGGETPNLNAYVFSAGERLIGIAPVRDGVANVAVSAEFEGAKTRVFFGPAINDDEPVTVAALKRMNAVEKLIRILPKELVHNFKVPAHLFPSWCFCLVKGRLVKRITLPDGTVNEMPVCNARVNIYEVDAIPWVINKLPEHELWKLRDDLLELLQIPLPQIPPIPLPDPPPDFHVMQALSAQAQVRDLRLNAVATASSAHHLRERLINISDIIKFNICDLMVFWRWFRKDYLRTVYADANGRFSTLIVYPCSDTPDLYFTVEQFTNGAWHNVYAPSLGCGTFWDYQCGTEIVINIPGAHACEEPTYDPPAGVTKFVLPFAIGATPIWGTPLGSPAAPDGWLRQDGKVNYATGTSLGWLYDAPFARTLNFIQDDSYYIPSSGIKYYRYSYRRASGVANTGANDASWTPITTPLARGYRMEYSDRLPTYESYAIGPFTVGAHSGLFEFKPQLPPARPTDASTVVVREWTSGNLSEVAASWNTLPAAPPLSDDNTTDDAGVFEVKIEVFDASGNQVTPGSSTFSYIARNADGTTTRLATAAEQAGSAYVFKVHVDNNAVSADLPQPSVGGVSASDDCGFLRYEPGDSVRIQYLAAHPNNHAVFGFGVTRGSNNLAAASTLSPYVEVASSSAATGTTPYNKVGDYYRRDFAPGDLVGTCVNAAFAAQLSVYGKATNGYERIGIDASRLIAFALAESAGDM